MTGRNDEPSALTPALEGFLRTLWQAPVAFPHVFDPWTMSGVDDVAGDGPTFRQQRLQQHLAADRVSLVLVGEAPGYQGARASGVPFTSERLLARGAVPRVSLPGPRITTRRLPWSEPSATILWAALYQSGLADSTVLWNAFPWHPHRPGNPLSNRTPTSAERQAGLSLLDALVRCLPGALVVAVGQHAAQSLVDIGQPARSVRHPANGGATVFRFQMQAIAAELC